MTDRTDHPRGRAREGDGLAALLARVAEGDRLAFRALYGRTAAQVFGVALKVVRDRDLAEEAAQDAFVAIWRRAGSYDPGTGSAAAWIGTVARNRSIDALRRRRARPDLGAPAEPDDLPGDGDHAARTLDRLALARLVTALRPDHRRALVLALAGGYSHAEVAAALEVPVGTAKCWVRRGLAAVRALTMPDGAGARPGPGEADIDAGSPG